MPRIDDRDRDDERPARENAPRVSIEEALTAARITVITHPNVTGENAGCVADAWHGLMVSEEDRAPYNDTIRRRAYAWAWAERSVGVRGGP